MITKPIKPSKQITYALPDILDTPWNPRIYTFIHDYKQTEFYSSRGGGGGGGKGPSTKFYTGKLCPDVQPLNVL